MLSAVSSLLTGYRVCSVVAAVSKFSMLDRPSWNSTMRSRGTITAFTIVFRNRVALMMMFSCSAPITRLIRAMSAMVRKSATLIDRASPFCLNGWAIHSVTAIIGLNPHVNAVSIGAKPGASRWLKLTPITFGMISVPNRITIVNTAENTQIHSSP